MPAGKAPKTNDAMKKKNDLFIFFQAMLQVFLRAPKREIFLSKLAFTCSKSTMKTAEQCWKFVQS